MFACPRRLGLLLLVVLAVAAAQRQQPPLPVADGGPKAAHFSAERARRELVDLLGEGEPPHPVGSPEGEAFLGRLLGKLRALGLDPDLDRRFACGHSLGCARIANVVADLPGGEGPRIVLVAHHDSRSAAPGAADAGAAVVTLLEVARALLAGPPTKHPVRLLFTDAEELDLIGAAAYASRPGVAEDTRAMINLEARGTGGPSLMFETSSPALPMIERFARRPVNPVTSSLFFEVYRVFPNDTDMTEFRRGGLKGLNFAFMSRPLQYHTPRDSLANLSDASLQHHGEQALAAVRSLDEPGPLDQGGEAVYFDLLSSHVVWFSQDAGRALAWLGVALWALALGLLLHRDRCGLLGLGGATLAWLLAPLLALALGGGLERVLAAAGALPGRWVAAPGAALTAARAAGALAAVLAGALALRLGGGWGAYAALGLWTAGLGAAGAHVLPGAAYLLAVPALVGGAVSLVAEFLFREPLDGPGWLGLPAALAFGVVWLPLLPLLADGLGFDVPGLHALAAALPAMGVAALAPGLDRRLVGGLVALALGAGVVAAGRAPHTEAHPRPLVLRYQLEVGPRDAARAEWIAVAAGPGLPKALTDVVPFRVTDRTSRELKARHPLRVAEAPALELPAPEVDRIAVTAREVDFSFRSTRGAFQLGFRFDSTPEPSRLEVGGEVVYDRRTGLTGTRKMNRVPVARLRVPPGEAVAVRAWFDSAPKGTLRVWDESRGLPEAGAELAAARPPWCAPAHEGDRTRVLRVVPLPGSR
jgi:hypothetical protein